MLLLAPILGGGGVLRKADAGAVVGEHESLKVPPFRPSRKPRFLELSPSVLGVGSETYQLIYCASINSSVLN